MNAEIIKIIALLKDEYNGDPWFGRSIKSLLNDVKEEFVFEKLNEQHSILELLWHMIIWREFTINSFRSDDKKSAIFFEKNDWQNLDHNDKTLWQKGLEQLDLTQTTLIETLQLQQDNILEEIVPGRKYNFKKLLYGIIAHDIYHIGQVAFITKLFQKT